MKGSDFITFNVGGTRYTTACATIEQQPHTTLAMLLRRHVDKPDEELFIDQDGALFRWVLLWYRSAQLVDHVTAGVPEDVWSAYIGWFCLDKPDEDALEPVTKKPATELDAAVERKREALELAKREREANYDILLTWMLGQHPVNLFDFVQKSVIVTMPEYYGIPSFVANVLPAWIFRNSSEFTTYAATKSIQIKLDYRENTVAKKFTCNPALNVLKEFPESSMGGRQKNWMQIHLVLIV